MITKWFLFVCMALLLAWMPTHSAQEQASVPHAREQSETSMDPDLDPGQQRGDSSAVMPNSKKHELDDNRITLRKGLTAHDALLRIFDQIPLQLNYLEMLTPDDLKELQQQVATFYTDTPLAWEKALHEVIHPYGLDFMEDNGIVRIGPAVKIEQRLQAIEQERLRRNRTRIHVNFAEGTPLYSALLFIRSEAGININFDYMDPADRNLPLAQEDRSVDAGTTRPVVNSTTYSTPEGQPVEWRVVLREVLNPFDYDFVEHNGVVRPMKSKLADDWKQKQIDMRPLHTRMVRVYHASPSDIVERADDVKDLLRHKDAFIKTIGKDQEHSHSRRFSGSSLNAPSGSGETMGGEVGSGAQYGSMHRFRVPPSLLIADVEENLERIDGFIRLLDVRERQVLIEAKIFELSANSGRSVGVDWGSLDDVRLGGGGEFSSSFSRGQDRARTRGTEEERLTGYETITRTTENGVERTIAASDTESFDEFVQKTFARLSASGYSAILNPLQFSFFWQAAQQAEDFEVLSQPILVIGDHSEAVIRVGTLEPIVSAERTFVGDDARPETIYDADYVQTGISLWVVPEISPDGKSLRLSIHPQTLANVGVVRPVAAVGENTDVGVFPIFSIREIDTRVIVPSGHTLILGGLIESGTGKQERKVPLLGDIPVLGRLFRWESAGRDGRNLVILLTPTILDDELPDTGYEAAASPYLTDLNRGLGRDLNNRRPDVDEVVRERRDVDQRNREEAWNELDREEHKDE
jgi:type II secretory pathway component GspD/PulD (secretin)